MKRDELTAASIIEQYPMLITLPDITPNNGIGHIIKAFNISSTSDIDNLSTHEVGYLALCLLPHILQPRTIQGKERKRDRFSTSTALSHLIQFEKAGNSMYAALDALKKEKDVTQPCILAFTQTGSMGGKLCDIFVIVDAVSIMIPDVNVSVSVETLFASFFTFNLSYPPSLCGVYSLFEMLFGVMPSIKSTLAVADLYSRIISAA
uniref:Uncharacterized protein n=1 Tax=Plectus sambesii TaxID=2011161 RepID=A0A914X662_9BILA